MKEIFKYSPNLMNLIWLIYSFLANAPTYFELTIKSDDEIDKVLYSKDMNLIKNFRFCGREEYFTTRPGQLILFVVFLLRELATLIFHIIISILTLIYFRKYLNRRAQIVVVQEHNEDMRKKIKTERKNEKKVTIMILYFMTFSIICHSISAIFQICLIFINSPVILYHLLLLNFVIYTFKNATNFFFFYFLNNKFRETVNLTFRNIYSN
jgi:hypothetical protein